MAKIGQNANAIAFAKIVTLGRKLKFREKHANGFKMTLELFSAKKRCQKEANSRKMTASRKWPQLAKMQGL